MVFPLEYCRDGWQRLERLRELYEQRPQDKIYARMEIATEALKGFAQRHPDGPTDCPDLDERVGFWDAFFRERLPVSDDSIPGAYLSELDQGLYGGMVGGEVRFMAHPENGFISSMVPPIFKSWSDLAKLAIDHQSGWHQFYLRELDTFRRGAEGRFGISHFILIDSLNFIFELFGASRTYLELFDNPEYVRQAVDFAYQLNADVQQTFFTAIPLLAGGTCSIMMEWLPGRIVCESVDPFHMTSVDYFDKWGREPAEQMLTAFDGGVLHIHGNGRHLLEAVSTLRGLKGILLGDDQHFPAAFSVIDALKAQTGDIPLVVQAGFRDFQAALAAHRLPGGILYKVLGVPNADTANGLMDEVRAYRM
jgi:hypothetical protein